jgi:hypothetical protein
MAAKIVRSSFVALTDHETFWQGTWHRTLSSIENLRRLSLTSRRHQVWPSCWSPRARANPNSLSSGSAVHLDCKANLRIDHEIRSSGYCFGRSIHSRARRHGVRVVMSGKPRLKLESRARAPDGRRGSFQCSLHRLA